MNNINGRSELPTEVIKNAIFYDTISCSLLWDFTTILEECATSTFITEEPAWISGISVNFY